ncbi:MAG TPA: hypothetical protein VFP70_13545 [Burkholderiales bacterium]|nr:hypothetical protein [Burkholderiales bacterium]
MPRATVLLLLLPGLAWGQAGAARDTQLQRQQGQDEVVRKIQQSQEFIRPGPAPRESNELEQARQREFHDDQARRARQLEQDARSGQESRPDERRTLQDQGFEREKIQQPGRPAGPPPGSGS